MVHVPMWWPIAHRGSSVAVRDLPRPIHVQSELLMRMENRKSNKNEAATFQINGCVCVYARGCVRERKRVHAI